MDNKLWIMLVLFLWLTGLSAFDVRYRKVPVWLLLLGGAAALCMEIYGCARGERSAVTLLGGMIPGVALILLAMTTRKAGWADGIVLTILGSVLGFWQCMMATAFSLVMLSALSAILLFLKKADGRTRIPYVPFLTMGFVLCKWHYTA